MPRKLGKVLTSQPLQSNIQQRHQQQRKDESGGGVTAIIPENKNIRKALIKDNIISERPSISVIDENYSSSDEEKMEIPESELLATITQNEQSSFECVDYQTKDDSNYNLVFGDLQQWRIHSLSEDKKSIESESLWFLKDQQNRKQKRKIFLDGKVHRVHNINADDQTFEAKIHLFLTWMITKDEYSACIKENEANEQNRNSFQDENVLSTAVSTDFDKVWYPCIHIPNLISGKHKFIENVSGSKFNVVTYKKFAGFDNSTANEDTEDNHSFQIKHAQFIRCKVQISGVFFSWFELKNFPFDFQDLGITFMERSGRGTFLPAFRQRKQFMNVDSLCFEVKEWDLEATMFEFTDTNPAYDNNAFGKMLSQFIIRFKYKRNYKMYVIKYIIIMMSITALSLLSFTFKFENNVDRSGFLIGLLLTIGFMDYSKPNTDYMTILDRYKIMNYSYLIFMCVVTSVAPMLTKETVYDTKVFFWCLSIFTLYHLGFFVFCYVKHKQEWQKINQTYNEDISQMIDDEDSYLDRMRADYTKPMNKSINNNRDGLTFLATRELRSNVF